MNSTGPGIEFNETMRGAFALDETDPEQGQKAGRRNGTHLTLNSDVSIDDVERFKNDPEHEGDLTGSIEFGPFGDEIETGDGVFKLFCPGDAEDLKLMVYEVPFDYDGTAYYFAGKKKVRNDPGVDIWADTTTLYSRLHEGPDKSAPVVGAGILRMDVSEVIKVTANMRPTNADSLDEKAQAFTTFGQFFLGELWDTYATHLPIDLEEAT